MAFQRRDLGHGIGLRTRHFARFLEERPAVDWVEAISENFMAQGGRPLAVLEKVRVRQVQDRLGRQILLENPSSYVAFKDSTMKEWEFLSELARRADCGILLDVDNVYVSARNFGFDPIEYLDGIPADRVGQFHLAGHTDKGRYLLDTHDEQVPAAVWDLYIEALHRFGKVPSLVEWDDHIPAVEEVVALRAKS